MAETRRIAEAILFCYLGFVNTLFMRAIVFVFFFSSVLWGQSKQLESVFIEFNKNQYSIVHFKGNVRTTYVTLGSDKPDLVWDQPNKSVYFTTVSKTGKSIQRYNASNGVQTELFSDSSLLTLADVDWTGDLLLISGKWHREKGELYTYRLSTGELKRITYNNFAEYGAKFEPLKAEWIVTSIVLNEASQINSGGRAELFVIDLFDLKQTKISGLGGMNTFPVIAPDGVSVVFQRCTKKGCDIYLTDKAGTTLVNLTPEGGDNRYPSFSRDGKWIAYSCKIENNGDVYLMKTNGRGKQSWIEGPLQEESAHF